MASVTLNKILKIIESAKDLGPYSIEYETQKRINVKASKFVGKRSEVLSILNIAFNKARTKPELAFPQDGSKARAGIAVSSQNGGIIFPQSDLKGYAIQAKDDKAVGGGLSTDEQETLQAYYIAVALTKRSPTYSPEEFKSVERIVVSQKKHSQFKDKVNNDWTLSSQRLVKHIQKEKLLPSGSGFTIQSNNAKKGFVDEVYKRFLKLIKETKMAFMDKDKWNPGDIWYIDDSIKSVDLDQYTSVVSLNKFLVENYEKKKIIPISLKQLVTDNVKTFVKNYEPKIKKLKFEGFDMGKQSFFKSIDANLFFNGSIAECRTFTGTSLSSEIKGEGAKGGKIAASIINIYLKKYNSKKFITDHKKLGPMIREHRTEFIKKLCIMAKKLDPRLKNSTVIEFMQSIDESKYAPAGSQPEFNYLNSKYQAAEMMDAIDDLSKKNKDDIVTDMMSYAGSVTELSSVHIVIRN